jgi:pectinesterase inhibitor-like protein
MARPGSLPLLAALLLAIAALAAAKGSPAATDFIRKSCRETQYPSVCVQSLSSYGAAAGSPPPRSPQELARAALSVSADRAKSASAYVGRLCGGQGLRGGAKGKAAPASSPARDCLENMADSVGHLRDAAKEMGAGLGRAGTPAFRWHLSNVQTWCSAALTDENTCLDGLSRGVDTKTRAAIRSKVVDVAQVTSNALALVNKVGSGH